jgi:hypothetical protein
MPVQILFLFFTIGTIGVPNSQDASPPPTPIVCVNIEVMVMHVHHANVICVLSDPICFGYAFSSQQLVQKASDPSFRLSHSASMAISDYQVVCLASNDL